jgi:hypothetical protein
LGTFEPFRGSQHSREEEVWVVDKSLLMGGTSLEFRIFYNAMPGGWSPVTTKGEVMKKQAKKLALAKETLHSLEENSLGKAAGGLTAGAAAMSYYTTCPS